MRLPSGLIVGVSVVKIVVIPAIVIFLHNRMMTAAKSLAPIFAGCAGIFPADCDNNNRADRSFAHADIGNDDKNDNPGKSFYNCYDNGGNDDNFNHGNAYDDDNPDGKRIFYYSYRLYFC